MRTEPIDKWVRGIVGETVVVDTKRPLLFYEDDFPVPSYAFEPADVRTDLLQPTEVDPPRRPFFYRPQGPVSRHYDLLVEDRTISHVAWRRDHPDVASKIIFSWQPGLVDRWLEEDEEVFEHPRSPHHRVEVLASSRHVVVRLNGVVLADTRRPVLLFETGLPTRYYIPEEDMSRDALAPGDYRSRCPYKGIADRYWSMRDRTDAANIAWSYTSPLPAVGKIAGRVAFYNELVDITLDDIDQPRPVSPFSRRSHRQIS